MAESKDGISRRSFAKAGLAAGGALVVGKVVKDVIQRSNQAIDLENPQTLEKFSGEKELFEGYHPFINGLVIVQKGTPIYSVPSTERNTKSEWPFASGETRSAKIGEVKEDRLIIQHPYLVLRKADNISTNVITLKNPDPDKNDEVKVDLARSYLVFGNDVDQNLSPDVRDAINANLFKVGCISLGDGSLSFVGLNDRIESLASTVTFKKDLKIY
jgi:hypothetical protein